MVMPSALKAFCAAIATRWTVCISGASRLAGASRMLRAGAFTDEAQAKERLENVREALGAETLKAHPDFVMRVTLQNGTTMYRARLGRFVSEAQASTACKRLKKSGIECWGIPVD